MLSGLFLAPLWFFSYIIIFNHKVERREEEVETGNRARRQVRIVLAGRVSYRSLQWRFKWRRERRAEGWAGGEGGGKRHGEPVVSRTHQEEWWMQVGGGEVRWKRDNNEWDWERNGRETNNPLPPPLRSGGAVRPDGWEERWMRWREEGRRRRKSVKEKGKQEGIRRNSFFYVWNIKYLIRLWTPTTRLGIHF